MVRPLLPADESVRRIGSQSAVVDLLIHSRRRRSDGAGEVCELRRQAVVVLARPLWSLDWVPTGRIRLCRADLSDGRERDVV
jgi:hypothetical protein